jgi:hypothetical protein
MLLEPLELWRLVNTDSAYVVRHCRALAHDNDSGEVRARLAHLAEYAELIAADTSGLPIRFAGNVSEPSA